MLVSDQLLRWQCKKYPHWKVSSPSNLQERPTRSAGDAYPESKQLEPMTT